MASFKDTQGRVWDVAVNLGQLMKVKSRLGLCLVDLSAEDVAAKRSESDLKRLSGDVELSINLLYVLCEKQCQERDVGDEAFGLTLDLDAWADALAALKEELTVFTLPRTTKERGRELARKQNEIAAKVLAAEALRSIEAEELVPAATVEAMVRRMIAGNGSASSTLPTSLPGSSG